jgi:hypothetical protein
MTANTVFIATRCTPAEAKSLRLLAEAKDHAISAELREAVRAHLRAAADALNGEGPDGGPDLRDSAPMQAVRSDGSD